MLITPRSWVRPPYWPYHWLFFCFLHKFVLKSCRNRLCERACHPGLLHSVCVGLKFEFSYSLQLARAFCFFDDTVRLYWRQELLRHSGAGSADTPLIEVRVDRATPKLPDSLGVSMFYSSVYFEWINLMFASVHDRCSSQQCYEILSLTVHAM